MSISIREEPCDKENDYCVVMAKRERTIREREAKRHQSEFTPTAVQQGPRKMVPVGGMGMAVRLG